MASLYDNYNLANSTAIPQFEGSAGEDYVKVGQYKQGLYDANSQNISDTGIAAGDVSSIFHQDQGVVQDLQDSVSSQIADMAKKGDYENMGLQARQLGMNFTNRRAEIMAPQQQAGAYKTSLGSKELNLTPEQQQKAWEMSLDNYQGLQKDARGRYVGTFSGYQAAKNVDVTEKVDKIMKDKAVHEGGDTTERDPVDGQMWVVKNGIKFKRLDPGEIARTVQEGLAGDSEYQAYKKMNGDFAEHSARKLATVLGPDQTPGMMAYSARQHAEKMGVPFKDMYGQVVRGAAENGIENNAMQYAMTKYAKNDVTTERTISADAYTLKDHDKSLTGPFMIQGPDNKLTNDEKDYGKLSGNVADQKAKLVDLNAHLTAVNKNLTNRNLPKETRTQMEADQASTQQQVNALQQQTNRGEDIQNYSKLTTAQKMGYQDYDDFLKSTTPQFTNKFKTIYPSGIPTKGKTIFAQDLAEAAVDGRLKVTKTSEVGPNGSVIYAPDGMEYTDKDGKTTPLTGKKSFELMDAYNGTLGAKGSKVNEFQNKLEKEHADNVKDFAIQSTNIAIPTEESRGRIKDLLISNKDNIRFSHPGQLDKVDAPSNFRVVSIGTAGIGADTKLQVEELDKDNKPTGNTYDATTSNSNIAEQLGREFGRSDAPEAKLAGDALATNSGARQVQSLIPGQSFALKRQVQGEDGNPINAELKVVRNRDKTISYVLRDAQDGTILKSTGSAVEAGRWVDNINGMDTYSNNKKKLIK